MAPLEIVTVSTSREKTEFVDFPWDLYRDHPLWVPPLKAHVKRLLDPSRHPFWQFSEGIRFLARRGGSTVGRIAGIIDGNYNRYRNEKVAAWGFFECRDDPEAAAHLFSAVEIWARSKGMEFMRGPLSPSMNYECGTLIEGFEYAPTILMPYNPDYYPALIESCGFTKEKDLIALSIVTPETQTDRINRLVRRLKRTSRFTIRPINMKNLFAEVKLISDIYKECWADNWGFTPMTEDELKESVRDLPRIADPELVFFVYYEDDPAGICMLLPDVNPLLKRLNGKIGLLGPLKIWLYRKEVTGLRGVMFGFKERYQKLGASLIAWDYAYDKVRAKGYRYFEMGWNLDDNRAINRFDSELGGRINKRYRIYRKGL